MDHRKEFVMEVRLDGILLGAGAGVSKKKAAQMAAKASVGNGEDKNITYLAFTATPSGEAGVVCNIRALLSRFTVPSVSHAARRVSRSPNWSNAA